MFIYEKDGKLNIMLTGNKPAAADVTPDIVIESFDDDGETKAKVTINGKTVSVEAGAGEQ